MAADKAGRVDACEVVVVGAGLVGATVAAGLAAEGLQVAVLEARDVARGATGRALGLTSLPLPYAQLVQRYGRETARALWKLTLDNRARLTSAAERLGLPPTRRGSLILATGVEQAELLQTSAQMLGADGFDARFEETDPLSRGFESALHLSADVAVEAVLLTERLLSGIPVHAGTEVYGLRQDGDEVLVLARGRTVKASTVVLAVNAYAPLLDSYFADKVTLMRGHLLVTQPLSSNLIPIPGSVGPFSFRQSADERLLFTAWRPDYETPPTGPEEEGGEIDLMRFVGRHFSEAVERFARRSSGVMAASRDGLPLLGALPHLPQVFFAVGFGPYGLSFAFAAADLLVGLIVRGAEPALLSARRLE